MSVYRVPGPILVGLPEQYNSEIPKPTRGMQDWRPEHEQSTGWAKQASNRTLSPVQASPPNWASALQACSSTAQ